MKKISFLNYLIFLIILIVGCNRPINQEGNKCINNSCFLTYVFTAGYDHRLNDSLKVKSLIKILDDFSYRLLEKAGGFEIATNNMKRGCFTDSDLNNDFKNLRSDLENELKKIRETISSNDLSKFNSFEESLNIFFFSDNRLFNEEYLNKANLATVYNDLALCKLYLLDSPPSSLEPSE